MFTLPERPQARELCLKIGTNCVAIIGVYQIVFVLPSWDSLITQPVTESHGSTLVGLKARLIFLVAEMYHVEYHSGSVCVYNVSIGSWVYIFHDARDKWRGDDWDHAKPSCCLCVFAQLYFILFISRISVL